MIYTDELKNELRKNAYNISKFMIKNEIPFRLIIWNNNNWNKLLPDSIMEQFPTQIILDLKEQTLKESFITKDGKIFIITMFKDKTFKKIVEEDEIVAIVDKDQAIIFNNFEQEQQPILSKKEWIKLVGIPEKYINKSIEVFTDVNK